MHECITIVMSFLAFVLLSCFLSLGGPEYGCRKVV